MGYISAVSLSYASRMAASSVGIAGVRDLDVAWRKAEQVFGDKTKAAVWLSTPRCSFGGMTAIDFVKDQQSLERMIEALTQIEHGFTN